MFKSTKITAFQLAMLTVAYVASIRSLAISARFGFTCIFYYTIAIITFLLPSALISAELGTAWPKRGGVYIWVKEALGGPWGFLAIWLQFLTNVVFMPAFLAFIAATAAYIFMPEAANNKYFLLTFILIVFWSATFIASLGMQTASWISTLGVFAGTLIPIIIIISLGALWLFSGEKVQIILSTATFFPQFSKLHIGDLVFLAGLMYSFTGMEVSGAHAKDLKNTRDYSKGIFLAAILITIVGFGALSIAIVVPLRSLNLISGLMQAITIFFDHFHLHRAIPLFALLIVIGSTCSLISSIIGPSKGLYGSAIEGEIPPLLTKINKHNMPIHMFIFQGIVVSIIALAFLIFPNVSASYWFIIAVINIIYLAMYVLLFISAIVLRYKQPDIYRAYKVPGKNLGMWLLASIGLLSTTFIIGISFFPPTKLDIGGTIIYETLLITITVVLVGLGLTIYKLRKPHWAIKHEL